MRASTLVLVLVVAPAMASDFRLANLGDACNTIRTLEAAQGSTEVLSLFTPSGDLDHLEFRGQAFEREVKVLYNCVDGKMLDGGYTFSFEEKEQAVETFKAAYDGLVAVYGVPLYDNTPWQNGSLA